MLVNLRHQHRTTVQFLWFINYELFKKAQQAKSKKIQDENDSYKKSDLEWEGLTNRLRAEIDELNNDKEKLLTDNKDLNSQLSENETSKEIKEKVESLDVENKLIKEQLNARETQLTSLQAGWYFWNGTVVFTVAATRSYFLSRLVISVFWIGSKPPTNYVLINLC